MAMVRLAMFLARSPMRSRSLATRMAATRTRRSMAMGWFLAIASTAFCSMICCISSIARSAAMIVLALSTSEAVSASTASGGQLCAPCDPFPQGRRRWR